MGTTGRNVWPPAKKRKPWPATEKNQHQQIKNIYHQGELFLEE